MLSLRVGVVLLSLVCSTVLAQGDGLDVCVESCISTGYIESGSKCSPYASKLSLDYLLLISLKGRHSLPLRR